MASDTGLRWTHLRRVPQYGNGGWIKVDEVLDVLEPFVCADALS